MIKQTKQDIERKKVNSGILGKAAKIALLPIAGYLPSYLQIEIYGQNKLWPMLATGISILEELIGGTALTTTSQFDSSLFNIGGALCGEAIARMTIMTGATVAYGEIPYGCGTCLGIVPGRLIAEYLLRRNYAKNPEGINALLDDKYNCPWYNYGIEWFTYSRCRRKRDKKLKK